MLVLDHQRNLEFLVRPSGSRRRYSTVYDAHELCCGFHDVLCYCYVSVDADPIWSPLKCSPNCYIPKNFLCRSRRRKIYSNDRRRDGTSCSSVSSAWAASIGDLSQS